MNTSATLIEASADTDVPPLIWGSVVRCARLIANSLWGQGSVALRSVSAAEIRELNRRYRNVDEPTDVLSFPADGGFHRGDIALCWEQAARQAAENGNSLEQEALALVCHGLLHLAGYDHDTTESEAEMNRLTRELCKSAGVEVLTFGH